MVVCWGLCLLPVFSQVAVVPERTVTGFDLPPAPESKVLDEAGFFEDYPDHFSNISQRLTRLHDAYGVPVYLVVYNSLLDGTMEERPRELYEAWIGEGHDGVVVVCELDARRMEIAFPISGYQSPAEGNARMTRLPDHRLVSVINVVRERMEEVKEPIEYLDRLTVVLSKELETVLRDTAKDHSSTWTYIIITLGIGFVISVLGYYGHRLATRTESEFQEQYYFPEVKVRPRLGAPYGGARINVFSYRSAEEGDRGTES